MYVLHYDGDGDVCLPYSAPVYLPSAMRLGAYFEGKGFGGAAAVPTLLSFTAE